MPYFNVGTVGAYRDGRQYRHYEVICIPDSVKPAHGWYPSDAKGNPTGPMVERSAAVGAPGGVQPVVGKPLPNAGKAEPASLHELAARGAKVVGAGQEERPRVDEERLRRLLDEQSQRFEQAYRDLQRELAEARAENAALKDQASSKAEEKKPLLPEKPLPTEERKPAADTAVAPKGPDAGEKPAKGKRPSDQSPV